MTVWYKDKVVLEGTRDRWGLWNTSEPSDERINQLLNTNHVNFVVNVLCPDTTLRDRIIFLHAAFGYPVIWTLCKALDNGLVLPGHLTSKQVRKHLKFSKYTVEGHLSQERKFSQLIVLHHQQRKSKQISILLLFSIKKFTFAACMPITGKLVSYQTGRFVAPSISGNNYILRIYDYDSNTIHGQAMPDRRKNNPTVIKI